MTFLQKPIYEFANLPLFSFCHKLVIILLFRHFCGFGTPLWCLQRKGASILYKCIFGICCWCDFNHYCDELVSSCTGWCPRNACFFYSVVGLQCPCFSTFSIFSNLALCVLLLFQPALLYIVPAVIGFVAVHCIWNGDMKPVNFSFYNLIYNFLAPFVSVLLYMGLECLFTVLL